MSRSRPRSLRGNCGNRPEARFATNIKDWKGPSSIACGHALRDTGPTDWYHRAGDRHRLDGAGREIEPLLAAFAKGREADPVEHAFLVAADLENCGGRRAVHEVHAPLPSLAFQHEAAHAQAREPRQTVLPAGKR